jgi:hypothetical protein
VSWSALLSSARVAAVEVGTEDGSRSALLAGRENERQLRVPTSGSAPAHWDLSDLLVLLQVSIR